MVATMINQALADVDALIVRLVESALSAARRPAQRHALLQQATRLTRQAANPLVQGKLLAMLHQGAAPGTLAEFQACVDQLHASRRLPSRVSRRLGGPPAKPPGRVVEPVLTPGEVARELGVSPKTIANWCKQGLLRCEVLESGHRRIPASALDAYRASEARWQKVDALKHAPRGLAPVLDEDAIFAEIAERRRG